MWQQWVNLVLGLWVVLSGYLNLSPQAYATDLTISGLAIAALALWGALQHRNRYESRRHSHA
jgi:hypothetical protein